MRKYNYYTDQKMCKKLCPKLNLPVLLQSLTEFILTAYEEATHTEIVTCMYFHS